MNPITVMLAEDHLIVREGLKKLLESESDIKVICEAATGRDAVNRVREFRPAVIVMDIAMPVLNGLEATRQIRQADPDAKVLILSAHSDDAYVEGAMAAGARGYLLKQTSAHYLSEAIREVQKGDAFFSPTIAQRLRKQNKTTLDIKGRAQKKNTDLTSREIEVLQLIAEGAANKQIAATLAISAKTVEKHRAHLMQKLDIHETAGLTRFAISTGIIESSVQLTIV